MQPVQLISKIYFGFPSTIGLDTPSTTMIDASSGPRAFCILPQTQLDFSRSQAAVAHSIGFLLAVGFWNSVFSHGIWVIAGKNLRVLAVIFDRLEITSGGLFVAFVTFLP